MDDGGCILFSCRPPLAEFGNCGVELGLVRIKEQTTTKDTEFSNRFGGEIGLVRANRGGGLELSLIKVKENTTLNDTELGNRTGVEVGGSTVKEKIELTLVRVKENTVDNVSLPHLHYHGKCSIWPSGIAEMEPTRRIHDSFRDGNEKQTRRLHSSSIGDGNEKQDRKQSSSSIGEKQARRDNSPTGDGNEKQRRTACSFFIDDGNEKHDRRKSSSTEDGNEKHGKRFNSSSTGDDREKQATKQNFSIEDGNEKQVERPDSAIAEGSEKQTRRLYSCLEDGNEKDTRRQKSSTGDQNETQARREWNEKEARKQNSSNGGGNEKKARREWNENEARNQKSSLGDRNEKQALNMDYSTGDGNEKQTRNNDYTIRDVNKIGGRRPNPSIRDCNDKEVRNKSYSSIRDAIEKQARRSNSSIRDGNEMKTRVHNSSIEDVNEKQIKLPNSFIGGGNEKQGKSQNSRWDFKGVGHSLVELNAKHDESMNEVAEVTQRLCVSVSLEEGKRENEHIQKDLNHRKTFLSISQVSEDLIPANAASEESQKQDMSISLEERKRNVCKENSSKVHQHHQNKSHFGDIEGIKTQTKIRNKKLKNSSDLTIQETVVSRRPMLGHEGTDTKNDASEYNKESLCHLNKAEKYQTYPDSHTRGDRSHYSRRSHSREHRYRDRGLKQEIKKRKTSIDHGSRYCRSRSRDHKDHGTYHDHRISKRDFKGRRLDQNDHEVDYSSRKNSHQGRESLDGSTCRITESDSRVRRDCPHSDRDLHRCGGYHKIRERLYESRASFNQEESIKHPNGSDKCISRSSLPNKIDTHIVDSGKDNSYCLDKRIDRRSSTNKDNAHIVESHKEHDRNSNKCTAKSSPTCISRVERETEQGRKPASPSYCLEVERQPDAIQKEGPSVVEMDLSPDPVKDIKEAFSPLLNHGTDDWLILEHARLPNVTGSLKHESINKQCSSSMSIQNTFQNPSFFNHRSVSSEGMGIDKRVEYLMQGFTLVQGREEEVILEALTNATKYETLDHKQESDDESGVAAYWNQTQLKFNDYCFINHQILKESIDAETIRLDIPNFQSSFQTSQKWTARGGDWKLICEFENVGNPNCSGSLGKREKIVLNKGIPLCERRHCQVSDPRIQSSLYGVSTCRTFEMPQWAYQYWEETKGVCVNTLLEKCKTIQTSISCTPRSQILTPTDSVDFDSSKKNKSNKVIPLSEGNLDDANSVEGVLPGKGEKTPVYETYLTSARYLELEQESLQNVRCDNIVVDKRTINSFKLVQKSLTKAGLKLDKGDWFYLDGKGQEVGPSTYMELQLKAQDGLLYGGTSVYRKCDKIWVPLTVDGTDLCSRSASSNTEEKDSMKKIFIQRDNLLSSFHELFPQFIGYMCGKLHEHVMKSYKSRDFSAMLHEGSRNCFRGKKSRDVSMNDLTITSIPGQFQFGNSSGPAVNESLDMRYDQDKFVMTHREMGISPSTMDAMPDSRNDLGHMVATNEEAETWSLIEPQLLMRVFSFLETDMRSLVLASIICKQWRAVFISFKKEMIQIDLSSLGSLCSDDIFQSLTEDTQNVSRVILRGCTTLSPSVVKAYLHRLQYIEHIDAKGCDQLKELTRAFPQNSFSRNRYGALDSSHQKYRSTKVFGERKSSSISKHSKILDDGRARRLNFTSVHLDEVTEPVSYSSHGNSDASQVRSSENAKRFKSLNKLKKLGPDRPHHKLGSKEQNSYEHKQVYTSRSEVTSLSLMKEDSSPVLDGKLEKDMAFVLQNLKDAKVPDGRKVSSDGPRASAYREIEDKLRRGLYPSTIRGFRTFKSDLLSVARMLFRGKDKEAGTVVLGNTFRLIAQLDEEFKCRDIALSNPHKRKYEEYKSGSSLVGRKRGIENIVGEPGFEKRRRNYDGSNDEDGYSFTHKTKTFGTDDEDNYSSHHDDKNPEKLDSEVESESEDKLRQEQDFLSDNETDNRIWGARMTKASMVPPATRKYKLIEEYVIVADEDEVKRRMEVSLPKDYDKIVRAQEDSGIEFSHLEMPELRDYKPRKRLQYEVLEQEVYGIDPYTHNLLMDSMPTNRLDFPDSRRHLVIEDLLKALNQEVRQFTGVGKAPTKFPLERVVNRALNACIDFEKRSFISALAKNIWNRMERGMNDSYVAYRKGLGVVCNHPAGFEKDEFIVEFFGEVYPAWRWYEKQDAIRAFQKQDQEAAPEFYNIFLERPKGDAFGYDLVVVDAMHKANYASRICHSCRPNCEARVTAVNGKYQIGVYTLRRVDYGEELTFDYNSITESKEEHEKSVCLCGSHVCRGSYLNFAGPDTFQEVMKSDHGVLHRYDLLLQACTTDTCATKDDWDVLRKSGLGVCLLDGLPDWMIKYTAGVMRFLNEERQSLPREILKTILSERGMEKAGESEVLDAEIQADGVFNTRIQNLAITLDKVRYIFKKLYGDPKGAPPPLRKLDLSEIVGLMWKNKNSVVAEVLHGMAQHISKEAYSEFMFKVHEHEPLESGDTIANLHQSLLWLRDELCKAPITCASRHDAAADLIHLYAHTKMFFTSQDYPTFESPPLTISPLDLGPKHAYKLGAAPFKKWVKTYSKDYVLGQLIFWYKPNEAEPGASLAKASRGCLILPDPTSCYAKSPQHRLSYSSMDRLKLLRRMERESQRQWNWKGQHFWEFKESWHLLGSPMMDAVHTGNVVNKEMMDWLKRRTRAFVSP